MADCEFWQGLVNSKQFCLEDSSDTIGTVWVDSYPVNANWSTTCLSQDGTNIVSGNSVYSYYSLNKGANWGQSAGISNSFIDAESSSDGSHIYAIMSGYFRRSIDFGLNFENKILCYTGRSVAVTLTANKIFIADLNALYVSLNYGETRTLLGIFSQIISVSCSGNGLVVVVAQYGGKIKISTDSGNSFIEVGEIKNWIKVKVSEDGSQFLAVFQNGSIYKVSLSDFIFNEIITDPNNWKDIDASADFSKIIACAFDKKLYLSQNSGELFSLQDEVRNWSSVAMSANAKFTCATVDNGHIYTSVE